MAQPGARIRLASARWGRWWPEALVLLALLVGLVVNYQPRLGPVGSVLDSFGDLALAAGVALVAWALTGFRRHARPFALLVCVASFAALTTLSWIAVH